VLREHIKRAHGGQGPPTAGVEMRAPEKIIERGKGLFGPRGGLCAAAVLS
jgi:hypothetical protein